MGLHLKLRLSLITGVSMIDVTYWELAGLLSLSPLVVYVAYWKGWNKGKREGYTSGRAISRIPMNK
jgi:hypothetical protein